MQYRKKREKDKKKKKIIIGVGIVVGILLLFTIFISVFYVREITVTGNSHYTEEEIQEKVLSETKLQNSILLYVKYQFLETEEIPFVDKIELSFSSPWMVEIRVYEKELVGYVSYMGSNFYFDKDGVVVGSTSEEVENVSLITGIYFDTLGLYRKLSVENEEVFEKIATISQLMEKYELYPDKINFSDTLEITLYFEELKIALGNDDLLEQKIGQLANLFPDLEGRSGTFRMENYTESSKYISFEQD